MHSSTSTQNVLEMSTLFSICAVVHTEIEYIMLNISAVRSVFFLLTFCVLRLQCILAHNAANYANIQLHYRSIVY